MAARILLVSANRYTIPEAVFPLGLAHLNAALRRAGHDTRWHDCHADAQPFSDVLAQYRPDFVGISVRNIDDILIRRRETCFDGLGEITQTVRRVNDCPVILGGSGYSIFPRRLLARAKADYGIQGEGEASFPALISALSDGGDLAAIPGLVYRRGEKLVANPRHPWWGTSALEVKDRPERLVRHYLRGGSMLNVQTQRGCAQSCCYCAYPVVEGRQPRQRPPEIVAEEMAQLEAQGAHYVFVVDSVFNSSPRHVTETCEAILRRGLKIRWACFLRPQGLTPALMGLMARAGLAHIEFGSDSFCDPVLEAYQKGFTFDDIRHSSEWASQQGVSCCHFLICGGPGETGQTLRTSFANSQRLAGGAIIAVVGMRVYPGTALCQRALREGQITPDTDLLTPRYYLAPALSQGEIFAFLRQFAARSPNWITGDPSPTYARLVDHLRRRGVAGPLWSYFSVLQRLWPRVSAERQTTRHGNSPTHS